MDQGLETVEWLLGVLTPESIDLCCVAIASCTKSAGILKGVVSVIHNRAVVEAATCPLYANLCSKLHAKLPTFNLLVIEKCQEALECSDRERFMGNIRLIGELWKQKMISENIVHSVIEKLLGTDMEAQRRPPEQHVMAVSELLRTIGKQLDESPVSRRRVDVYLNRLNGLAEDVMGALRVWFRVRSIVALRARNWDPNLEVTGDTGFESQDRVRYTRDPLLHLRKMVASSEEILKMKREIESEMLGEDPNWVRAASNVSFQAPSRYSDPNSRDWRGRSAQLTPAPEERSWESLRDNKRTGC